MSTHRSIAFATHAVIIVAGAIAGFDFGLSGASADAGPERGAMIGALQSYRTVREDTFADLARRFDLGFVELAAANPGIDPWLPGAGTKLVLPSAHLLPDAPHRGIVINLAEQRLYHFAPGAVTTFPVGTGRAGCETPVGTTLVVGKRENPIWTPPASILAERPDLPAAVPPGPDNPLGSHALDLAWPGYVIHGTNKPLGIGRRVSHGCVRLYPEDIAVLYGGVAIGTPVTVVDQPIKLGWAGSALFLEVHPTQAQADELEARGRIADTPAPDLGARVLRAAGDQRDRLQWSTIRTVARETLGIPVRITRPPF